MKLAWRSPEFFEEPGLFIVFENGASWCLVPFPRKRK